MTPRIPADRALRAQRKADLLLASELLRRQSTLAVDDLGQRADGWGVRVLAWRDRLSHPAVLAAIGGGAAFLVTAGRARRGRLWRALRWVWVGWQVWNRR